MAKFFRFPFGISGNRDTIPEPTDINGYVSYEQGYSLDYSRPIATDPLAKKVERTKQNQLFYDITLALQQYQTNGVPDFITAAENGGVAYAYPLHAVCRYDDGGGVKIYRNTVAGNTNIPTGAGWIPETNLDALASLTLAADKLPYATSSSAMALTTLTAFARSLLDDTTAATARNTLGLTIGTNVQAYDAGLQSISGLTTAADRMIYTTALDTYAVTTLTPFARSLLDDTTQSQALSTLGTGKIDVGSSLHSDGIYKTKIIDATIANGSFTVSVAHGISSAYDNHRIIKVSPTVKNTGTLQIHGGGFSNDSNDNWNIKDWSYNNNNISIRRDRSSGTYTFKLTITYV